jgi:hypothetical protein
MWLANIAKRIGTRSDQYDARRERRRHRSSMSQTPLNSRIRTKLLKEISLQRRQAATRHIPWQAQFRTAARSGHSGRLLALSSVLVAAPSTQDLLLRAKYLFAPAIVAEPSGDSLEHGGRHGPGGKRAP